MVFALNIYFRGISIMNTKIIVETLLKFHEFWKNFDKPILGKTLFEWLKIIFLYSFLIWFAIIGWNFYQDFLIVQGLSKQKNNILLIKNQKEYQLKEYYLKIKDIPAIISQSKNPFTYISA